MLKIEVAKDIGFCFGVDKAVQIAKDLLANGENVYVTGELIHNEAEMKVLEELGLKTFDIASKWPDLSRATVLIRAHGVPIDQLEKMKSHAKKVVDATCPVVLSLSESILEARKAGFEVLLYGHDKHDEVVFLKSVVRDLKVFDYKENVRYSTKKIALFSQTTMDVDGFKEMSKSIVENIEDLSTVMIKNSICNVTYQREREVKKLASENDVCLVVGSNKSSNTRKLFNIAKNINYKTYLVLSTADLRPEWFDAADSVGICSGTSTSMRIIDEIVERLRTFKN